MKGKPRARILELGDSASIGSAFAADAQTAEDILRRGADFASQAYQDAFSFLSRQANDAWTGNIADMFSTGKNFTTQQAQNTAQFVGDQADNTAQAIQQSAATDAAVATTAAGVIVPYLIYAALGIGGLFLLSHALGDD
jgi:hypothetical protein